MAGYIGNLGYNGGLFGGINPELGGGYPGAQSQGFDPYSGYSMNTQNQSLFGGGQGGGYPQYGGGYGGSPYGGQMSTGYQDPYGGGYGGQGGGYPQYGGAGDALGNAQMSTGYQDPYGGGYGGQGGGYPSFGQGYLPQFQAQMNDMSNKYFGNAQMSTGYPDPYGGGYGGQGGGQPSNDIYYGEGPSAWAQDFQDRDGDGIDDRRRGQPGAKPVNRGSGSEWQGQWDAGGAGDALGNAQMSTGYPDPYGGGNTAPPSPQPGAAPRGPAARPVSVNYDSEKSNYGSAVEKREAATDLSHSGGKKVQRLVKKGKVNKAQKLYDKNQKKK